MRGRQGAAVVVALGLLGGAVACGNGTAAVFRPGGSLPSQAAQAAPSSPPAGTRLGGFRFPPGVSIDFTSPAPADPVQRAIIAGYQAYVLSMWAGVVTHGKNTAYANLAAGNALTFVRHEVARYRSGGRTVRGTVTYSATRVNGEYLGAGASVLSCVNAAAFHAVGPTGATAGPALPSRPVRYLEAVSEGKRSDGTWYVIRSTSYPASSQQGAMCR